MLTTFDATSLKARPEKYTSQEENRNRPADLDNGNAADKVKAQPYWMLMIGPQVARRAHGSSVGKRMSTFVRRTLAISS